jgi:hypothetical protein
MLLPRNPPLELRMLGICAGWRWPTARGMPALVAVGAQAFPCVLL